MPSSSRPCAETSAALADFLKAHAKEMLAVTPTFEQPSHLTGALVGTAIAAAGAAAYVPLGAADGSLGDEGLEVLKAYLEDEAKPKIVHNTRDVMCLYRRHGIELDGSRRRHDPRVVPDRPRQAAAAPPRPGRQRVSAPHPAHRSRRSPAAARARRSSRSSEVDDVAGWACQLAAATAQAWPKISERLEAEGQTETLAKLSLPMAHVLADMQLAGIRVDKSDLEKMGRGVRRAKGGGRRRDLQACRVGVQHRLDQTARQGAVRRPRPAGDQEDQDRLLDRGRRARAPRATARHRQTDPAPARLGEVDQHLHPRVERGRLPGGRPRALHLPADHRGVRAPHHHRPGPAAHPDPLRGRQAHPPGVSCRARAGR